MASDKDQPLTDAWAARYDDRDDEELAFRVWALQLGARDRAMAEPISGFTLPDEAVPDSPGSPAAE